MHSPQPPPYPSAQPARAGVRSESPHPAERTNKKTAGSPGIRRLDDRPPLLRQQVSARAPITQHFVARAPRARTRARPTSTSTSIPDPATPLTSHTDPSGARFSRSAATLLLIAPSIRSGSRSRAFLLASRPYSSRKRLCFCPRAPHTPTGRILGRGLSLRYSPLGRWVRPCPQAPRHPFSLQQPRRCPQQVSAPASCLAKLSSSSIRANTTHRRVTLYTLRCHSLPASPLLAVPLVRAARMPLSARDPVLHRCTGCTCKPSKSYSSSLTP